MASEWKESTVGEQFDLANGFAFKSKDFIETGVPVIKIKNVKAGFFSEHDFSYVSPEFIDIRKDKLARVDDLLISMSGNRHDGSPETWVGKVARFNKANDYFINQRVGALRVKDDKVVNPRFASYLLSSWNYQQLFISIATSSGGQANLSPGQILGAPFNFPPLPEQKAIAHILGSLDDKIELNRRMNETLEGMAQALFKSWFVDFDPVIDNILLRNMGIDPYSTTDPSPNRSRRERDGSSPDDGRSGDEGSIFDGIPDEFLARAEARRQALADFPAIGTETSNVRKLFPAAFQETSEMGWIPEGWDEGKVGDLCSRVLEKIKTPEEWASETLIDLSRMPSKSIALAEWGLGEQLTTSVTRFRRMDTLFGAIRPYFHKVGIAPTNGVTNVSVFVIRSNQEPDSAFITTLCSMDVVVNYATNVSKGTKMPVVSWPDFAAYQLAVPPVRIRKEFGSVTNLQFEKIINNIKESHTLAKLRDTLLPKLISGELQIEDVEKMVGECENRGEDQ